MTLIETVLIIGSVVGGLMTTTCWNIRRSRCEKIESPCLSCMRKVMTEKELKMDVLTSNASGMTSNASGMTGDINNATLNRTYSQPETPNKMTSGMTSHAETPKMTSGMTSHASGMKKTQRFLDYNSAT